MNRLSGLLWLAILVLLVAASGSFAQTHAPYVTRIAVSGLECGQSANLSRSAAQYALHRPVAEPAVIQSPHPLYQYGSHTNCLALSIEMGPGLSLSSPQDVVIEVPQSLLTGLVRNSLRGQPQDGLGQMVVLIVLISNVRDYAPAGNILQSSRLIADGLSPDTGLAFAKALGEPRSSIKRGPTRWGNYTSREW